MANNSSSTTWCPPHYAKAVSGDFSKGHPQTRDVTNEVIGTNMPEAPFCLKLFKSIDIAIMVYKYKLTTPGMVEVV